MSETIRCPFCIDGEWFSNPEFKEPYGYPYRPAKIPYEICKGLEGRIHLEIINKFGDILYEETLRYLSIDTSCNLE